MIKQLGLTLSLALALGGCNSLLDTTPKDQLPEDRAITSAGGARAALAGAYNALQSGSYYGGDFYLFGDLSSDNAVDVGTFNSYADAAGNQLTADNTTIGDIWASIYSAIHRANVLIAKVPGVPDLDPVERDQILGEAYFLRALHYHNLVKTFGGVPLRLQPAATVEEASQIARATTAEVYVQILSDLQQSETLITNTSPATQATIGAVKALEARVYLYQSDWANAKAAADAVIGMGYTLAANYSDLFDPEGQDTPEDIFKVTFTAQQYQYMYYWISCSVGGGCELAPTQSLIDAYDPADERLAWSISGDTEPDAWGTKYPTTAGAEDIHAIRFAEVLLIKAEAEAQLNNLQVAVDNYNLLRVRAGVLQDVLGVDVTTQQDVLDAIDHERRLELAFEGDRWFDLVRTGRVATVLPGVPAFQYLYPIPQSELDVAPNLAQNPGY
ncbi:MAG: RagB/SusD family nutrient uptake outer membrane protein [Gemmatimonadota bacterium]